MKHCAKKLLGLAFTLALCLAVGGTALAETPMLAAVLAALPGQGMLADEPNVTTAADVPKTVTGDGYTVTIPTTVEVKNGENKGELMVTASVKQLRTLKITLDSKNNWQLKHESGQAQAGYSLTSEGGSYLPDYRGYWTHEDKQTTDGKKKPELSLVVSQKAEGDFDINWKESFAIPLTVEVDPSQATMSGTYTDTVSFEFELNKQLCVTYFINVYEQKLELTADGKSVQAVDVVDADGKVIGNPTPVRTEILEYSRTYDPRTWSYKSKDPEDAYRWEELTITRKPAEDVDNKLADANNNVTINLNLRRKCYYLDVNGATDYTNEFVGGNQGDHIGSCVEIMLSGDGVNWTDWFWHGEYGDDYWAKLPYGVHFKLGLHHVKNGYVYDTGTGTLEGNGVRIIANKKEEHTATGETVKGSTYYVYTGEMTGAPTGKDGNENDCYCYIPCYKKGLTYIANGGTGGTESVNTGNPPRTNVLYEETGRLESPEDLHINPPSTDMVFAGWSTSADYPTTGKLYQPGESVSKVKWEKYTDTSKRPKLDGKIDDEKRELYAIWGYDITVQFEDEKGYTEDGTSTPVLGGTMDNTTYSFTLKAQVVEKNKGWTLDLTNPMVQAAIAKATNDAKAAAGDTDTKTGQALERKIWKIDNYTEDGHNFDFTQECTIKAADLQNGKHTLTIQRRRYLLSVISANATTSYVYGIATDPQQPQYGTFTVTVNNGAKPDIEKTNISFYQCGLNYGAKYEIKNVAPKSDYNDDGYMVFKLSLKKGTMEDQDGFQAGAAIPKRMGETYFDFMTAKKENIHYYTNGGNSSTDIYTGDPVRIGFMNLVSSSKPGSDTPAAGPSLAPAKKKALTVRYHANFDPMEELALDLDPNPLLEDMDEDFGFDPDPLPEDVLDPTVEAVKIVTYQPNENVVLRNCMFKRGGYVFVGWNTEPDGTGKKYEVNGVPITDWAAGATVDLYAQWKKPEHLKPVVDNEPFVPADPDTPPERVDDGFDADFGVDPQPGGMDDAFGV